MAKIDEIDTAITPIIIQKLLKNIRETKHFRDGLVDSKGNLLREPEEGEITDLDLLVYKIKGILNGRENLLAPKLGLYKNYSKDTWYSRLMPMGNMKNVVVYKVIRDKLKELRF